jgi:hypothetical protein
MKPLRFLLLSLAVASASLVPQVPSQASELVKLGRLLVTGKRAPAAPAPVTVVTSDDAKAAVPVVRPVADAGDRSAAGSRSADVVQEARESGATPVAGERPAMEPKALDRGGVSSGAGGGAGVSSTGERASLIGFSLRGLLRGV